MTSATNSLATAQAALASAQAQNQQSLESAKATVDQALNSVLSAQDTLNNDQTKQQASMQQAPNAANSAQSALDKAQATLQNTAASQTGCLDRPTSGPSLLDGVEITHRRPSELAVLRNRKIGFIFQGFNLLPRMDALDNVMLPMVYDDVPTDVRQQRGDWHWSRSVLASASTTLERVVGRPAAARGYRAFAGQRAQPDPG